MLRHIVVLAASIALAGCASIPEEAPELSAQLGGRMSAMQSAHLQLLTDFFREKKNRVDDFVQNEWTPLFAKELFSDPRVAEVWDQVVKSRDPADRLKFILIAGPRLQQKINAKRLELLKPLEELESTAAAHLRAEYDNMRAINSTLTAFLQSASKVEANRKRYLELVGVSDKKIEEAIYETNRAVSKLLQGTKSAVSDAEEYKNKIHDQIEKLRKKGS